MKKCIHNSPTPTIQVVDPTMGSNSVSSTTTESHIYNSEVEERVDNHNGAMGSDSNSSTAFGKNISGSEVGRKRERDNYHNGDCSIHMSPICLVADLNNKGVELLSEENLEGASSFFQESLQMASISTFFGENIQAKNLDENSAKKRRQSDTVENNRGEKPALISDRLSIGSETKKVDPLKFVFNREIVDKEMAFFSDPILMNNTEEMDRLNTVATISYNMGHVFLKLKEYKNAFKFFFSALENQEKSGLNCCPNFVVAILYNAGRSLHFLGYIDKSFDCFKEAMKFMTDRGESKTIHAASTKTYMAALLLLKVFGKSNISDHGRKRIAQFSYRLLSDALKIKVLKYGKNHLENATILYHTSVALTLMKNVEGAKRALRKSLEIMQMLLPKHHPDVLRVMMAIAITNHMLGEYESGKEMMTKCFGGIEKLLGKDHRDISLVLVFTALTQFKPSIGASEAMIICQEALIRSKTFGEKYQNLAIIFSIIGIFHFSQNDDAVVANVLEEYLRIESNIVKASENFNLAPIHVSIGDYLRKLGDYKSALTWYHSVIQINSGKIKTEGGVDAFAAAQALKGCGYIHAQGGDTKKAVKSFAAAMNIQKLSLLEVSLHKFHAGNFT